MIEIEMEDYSPIDCTHGDDFSYESGSKDITGTLIVECGLCLEEQLAKEIKRSRALYAILTGEEWLNLNYIVKQQTPSECEKLGAVMALTFRSVNKKLADAKKELIEALKK